MRITVDIDDKKLKMVQKLTGLGKKSPAVQRAVDLYLRETEKKKLIDTVMERGCDYSLTNDELERRSSYDAH